MACTGLYVLEILSLHSSRGRVRATPTLGPADNAWRSEWRPREEPPPQSAVCLLLMRTCCGCVCGGVLLTPAPTSKPGWGSPATPPPSNAVSYDIPPSFKNVFPPADGRFGRRPRSDGRWTGRCASRTPRCQTSVHLCRVRRRRRMNSHLPCQMPKRLRLTLVLFRSCFVCA